MYLLEQLSFELHKLTAKASPKHIKHVQLIHNDKRDYIKLVQPIDEEWKPVSDRLWR